MARYSARVQTGAGTAARPILSLYAAAAVGARLREVGVTNTTNTAVTLKLARLTSQGTPGAGLTETKHDPISAAASCTAFTTHTADATISDDIASAAIGAAVGAGYVWTFGDSGIVIPVGTSNGVGLVPVGTGQVCEAYFVWDE